MYSLRVRIKSGERAFLILPVPKALMETFVNLEVQPEGLLRLY